MKRYVPLALSLGLAAFSLAALAHDPKLHKKEGAAAPDCSKMKDMDMSKMDPNDPVMKAMHDKCKDAHAKHDDMHAHDMKDMPAMDKSKPADASKP